MSNLRGSEKAYALVPFPRVRRAALDLAPSERKHLIHPLLEVDVTRARGLLAEYKAETGEELSFTAFIINCLARAVYEQKSVQGYRRGRRHLVIFDDVDVSLKMEQEIEGKKRAMFHALRAASTPRVFCRSIRRYARPNTAAYQHLVEHLASASLNRCPVSYAALAFEWCAGVRSSGSDWPVQSRSRLSECSAEAPAGGFLSPTIRSM